MNRTSRACAMLYIIAFSGCSGSGGGTVPSAAALPVAASSSSQRAAATITIDVPAKHATPSSSARKAAYISPSAQSIAIAAGGVTNIQNLTPTSPGCAVQTPAFTEYPAGGDPNFITAGPDGNMWVGIDNNYTAFLDRVTVNGVFTSYQLPGADDIQALVVGPDRQLWMTAGTTTVEKIISVSTSGSVNEFSPPLHNGVLPSTQGMTPGSDGNLWFVDNANGSVDPVSVTGGFGATDALGTYGEQEIATGSDGNLWIAGEPNHIAKLTPSGTLTQYPLPRANTAADYIAPGPDGALWFTEGDHIGRMTTAGVVTEFPVPSGDASGLIAAGPDGNMWFPEFSTNKIANITPSGAIAEYTIPTNNSHPFGIATGPDGNIWFTEFNAPASVFKVAKLTPPGFACGITANFPVGASVPVTVTLFDGLNATGNALSIAASTYTVTSAGPNTIAIVLNGVVDHIDVQLATSTIAAGLANSVAVNVNARDAQDNLIISPGGYVDALNDPLTLHLTDSDTSGATAITPTSITAPSPSIKLNYNGGAATSATISATVGGGTIAGAITGATLTIH